MPGYTGPEDILYISGIVLSLFLSFILFSKNKKTTPDIILGIWLLVSGADLFTFFLFFTGAYTHMPAVTALGFPMPLLQGPFLFLYTKYQTGNNAFRRKDLLHFAPALCSLLMFFPFYLLSYADQVRVFQEEGKGYMVQMSVNVIAIMVSGVIYIVLSMRRLLSFRKKIVDRFSNTDKIRFNWLLYLIIGIACIWVVILFVGEDHLIFASSALFILWLGYYGIKQSQVFNQHAEVDWTYFTTSQDHVQENEMDGSEHTKVKYSRSALQAEEAIRIHNALQKRMAEQKPFTDPELTLDALAAILQVQPDHLSQVINSLEGKNFYDYINTLRVEEFLRKTQNGDDIRYTLLALAFDCGFNSKASFNRNFKKIMGTSPSMYLNKG
ncbi:MAG: helix-turn-helix domain-containing protein [Chitinophagales bacterium]